MSRRIIDFDVETTGVQWYHHKLFLAQFGWADEGGERDEDNIEVLRHPEDRERIQWWLDQDADFRAWNSKFDLHFLEAAGYRLPPEDRWEDAMVKARLVDERRSAALKGRSSQMFGNQERDPEKAVKAWLAEETKRRKEASKRERVTWLQEHGVEPARGGMTKAGKPKVNGGFTAAEVAELAPPEVGRMEPPNYSDVPADIMEPYAAHDIVLTRKVGRQLDRTISDKLNELYEIEMVNMAALYRAERHGFPIDEAAARRFRFDLVQRLEGLDARARELAGKSNFNPGSSDQIAEALKRRGADLSLVSKTAKTGKLKMDAENLEAIDDELAQTILEFRAESKMLGTYVMPLLERTWNSDLNSYREPFIAPDGRLHGGYRQVGARTGRMSGAEPNMQNIPRDDLRFRYMLHAEPGYKLVTADLESIELKLFAMFVGPGRLKDAILSGADMHALTAQQAGLRGRQRINGFESPRSQGKVLNYQIVYGGGQNTIMKKFGVSRTEAKRIQENYHRGYPEVKRLQRRIESRLRELGYIQTPFARRQRVEDIRKESYKFTNYLIQGTAADMMKHSIARLHAQDVPIIAVVHDEIVAHVPEAEAEATGAKIVAALTDFPQLTKSTGIPITAEAAIVDRWSQAKDADFVPAFEKG